MAKIVTDHGKDNKMHILGREGIRAGFDKKVQSEEHISNMIAIVIGKLVALLKPLLAVSLHLFGEVLYAGFQLRQASPFWRPYKR
jgi:hypothetical protein